VDTIKQTRLAGADDAARARVDSAFVQRATPTKVRFDDDDERARTIDDDDDACPRVRARRRASARARTGRRARAMMGGGRAGGRADDPSEAGARASAARRAARESGDDANAWIEMVRVVAFAREWRNDDARGRWARAMGRGCDPKVAQALTADGDGTRWRAR